MIGVLAVGLGASVAPGQTAVDSAATIISGVHVSASPRYHARLAFDPAVVAEVRDLLARYWDPDGALAGAARALETPDLAQPRSIADYALAICGMLAAGGAEADVSAFLRREEAKLLGEPRSTGHTRMPLARACWRAVRGLTPTVPPKDVPAPLAAARDSFRDPAT